jgi:DNA-binding NarL/FixJ family response regulator
MNRPTIVLAEDHPNVAEQLRKLLADSFDVVAVVGHGEALVKTALRMKPDVVVTDISMPGMDGMKAAQEILLHQPSLCVVFVTVHDDRALARKALSIGHGYVLKTSAGDELVDAVNAVLDARPFVSASLGPVESLRETREGPRRNATR